MEFDQLLDDAMRVAHPDWSPESVANILRVVQKPMYAARTLDQIAAAWPRFAADPGALLHAFPYKAGAWWAPETRVDEELGHATSTTVVTMTSTSCAPIAPEHGEELPIETFLAPAELGDLEHRSDPNDPLQDGCDHGYGPHDSCPMCDAQEAPAGPAPSAQLAQLVESERALADRRRRLVVELVLDHGWKYAHIGRALGITRQAAAKTYGPLVVDEMRRRARAGAR